MRSLLGGAFVNSWVLAKELPRIRDALGEDSDLGRLCTLLEENYSYPVDSIVLAPSLEVLGQRDVNVATSTGPKLYLEWLEEILR